MSNNSRYAKRRKLKDQAKARAARKGKSKVTK